MIVAWFLSVTTAVASGLFQETDASRLEDAVARRPRPGALSTRWAEALVAEGDLAAPAQVGSFLEETPAPSPLPEVPAAVEVE